MSTVEQNKQHDDIFAQPTGRTIEYPEWQQEDVARLVNEKDCVHNWSEMGCYKTTTGLRVIKEVMERDGVVNPNVLVITTRTGKGTFFELAQEILEGWAIFDLSSKGLSIYVKGELKPLPIKQMPKKLDMPCIIVTHYQLFSRLTRNKPILDAKGNPRRDVDGAIILKSWSAADFVLDRHFDYQWIDEEHRIKEKDTTWTYAIKRIKATYRMGSTGSGFINRASEVWSLLNYGDRQAYGSFTKFREVFCLMDDSKGYLDEYGVKPEMVPVFKELMNKVGVRRTLDEVMPHIKRPIFMRYEVQLNKIQRAMYDEIKFELAVLDRNGVPMYAANVLALLQRLRAICVATPEVAEDYFDEKLQRRVQKIRLTEPSSKLDCFFDDVLGNLVWNDERKEPVVVFSNFVGTLQLLEARLQKAGVPYLWMRQSDNDQTRFDKWKVRWPSLQYRVFMSTTQLGGESINLTAGRHLVFLDRSWSPKDNGQAIGRVRRPGQEGQPVVINIEALDTTDQLIEDRVALKEGWFREIFGVDAKQVAK
jgi:SNF2 family DNA or RNA helicase